MIALGVKWRRTNELMRVAAGSRIALGQPLSRGVLNCTSGQAQMSRRATAVAVASSSDWRGRGRLGLGAK